MEWCWKQSENLTILVLCFGVFLIVLVVILEVFSHINANALKCPLSATNPIIVAFCVPNKTIRSFLNSSIPRQSFADGIGTYVGVAQVNQGQFQWEEVT